MAVFEIQKVDEPGGDINPVTSRTRLESAIKIANRYTATAHVVYIKKFDKDDNVVNSWFWDDMEWVEVGG